MLKKLIQQLGFMTVLAGSMILVKPALATYGYENTVPDCATNAAASNATLQVYTTFTAATADSISAEFIPSFDDTHCTVKLPIGYDTFGGVTVAATSNVQTSVGAEEIRVTLNADSSGTYKYTFTGLDPYQEYQFRVDGIYTKSSTGARYSSTSENEYYSTSGAPVTNLAVAADGTFSWTNPVEGNASNIKIDLTGLNSDGEVVLATTRYATSGESYDYYDFINKFYSGNYVIIATASMKKIYNGVDQRIWGTPTIVSFTTSKGSVVSHADVDGTAEDVASCQGLDAGESCTVTGDVVPAKPTLSKVTSTKATWKAVSGASSYKLILLSKSGKKLATYTDITELSKKFSVAKVKTFKLQACNAFGCSATSKKSL